jgi:ribosomal-protein-alanine N-acetyltransferase
MELKGNTFILRKWQAGDERSLQLQANNNNISRYLFDRFPYPYTLADAENWVAMHYDQSPVTNFSIVINEQVAGAVELKSEQDIHYKTFTLGYWLGQDHWRKGIMTEAVNLITNYAFHNFDIIRIQAIVNDNNPASMRVLEKAGFQKEGILKNAIVKNGEVMDEHLYALLK